MAAAFVLLTACGGSEETNPEASGSTGSDSGASESGTDAANSEFCTEAAAIQKRLGSTLGAQSDPATLPQALQAVATEIRAVEAPEEISADWNASADGVERIGAAVAAIDVKDPNALATFQQEVGALEAELSTASTNVDNYLRDECGLELDSTEPAAPTS